MRGPTPRLRTALASALVILALLTGCATTDTISQAERGQKDRPGFAETRAIAEEGFVYGLPLVMNYAVNYDFFVDKASAQYKSPFNTLFNDARVFTYKDTAVVTPNSDTPYSMLALDLRAEPYVLSVPAVDRARYYSLMLCDWNTFNYGYIGSRATGTEAGDYLVAGPDWQGQPPAGIKKVFRATTQFTVVIYRTQLFNAADMPNVVNVQAGYKVQPLSAYLRQPAPPRRPPSRSPRSLRTSPRRTSSSTWTSSSSSHRPAPRSRPSAPSSLASVSGPGRRSTSRNSASSTRWKSAWA